MPDVLSHLHPRKLHAMLRACPTDASRARAALDFLRAGAGADFGVLLRIRDGALEVAATTGDRAVPAGLVDEAARALASLRDSPPDDERTRDVGAKRALPIAGLETWVSASGERFDPRALTSRRPRPAVIGLVMLRVPEGGALAPVRHAHVQAICDAFAEESAR